MTPFKSYSQAQQDVFVHALIGDTGTFLDIGASHPQELSNTFGLESIGWTGMCVEIEHSLCDLLREVRANVSERDATKPESWEPFRAGIIPEITYLSLDIDERTVDALRAFPMDKVRFKVITIEHDAYRFGDRLRAPEREILTKAGYVLVAPDVANAGTPDMPFEDWWVSPKLADKAREILKDLWPSPKS